MDNEQVLEEAVVLPEGVDAEVQVEEEVVEEAVEAEDAEIEVEPTDVELKARAQGWRPESEYKGKDGGFVDAEAYLKNAEDDLPKVRQRLKTLTDRNVKTEKDMARVIEMLKKQEEERYAKEYEAIRSKIRTATAEGDTEGVDSFVEELSKLKPEPEAVKEPVSEEVAPVFADWIEKNQWFEKDEELNAVAIAQYSVVEKKYPGMNESEILSTVEDNVRKRYPEKFAPVKTKRKPVHVEGGNPSNKGAKATGFSDLSAQDQAQANRLIKRGLFEDKADYMKSFNEEYK